VLKKIFPIPFALWFVVTLAWFLGAKGVTFRVVAAQQDATIDFNRKYDHTAVELGAGIVLLDDDRVTRVERAWVPFCWVCGMNRATAPLMDGATHQSGPWVFRAPRPDPNFAGWSNQEGVKAAQTVAFNVATGERVMADTASSLAQLTQRGLVADDAHRLDRSRLSRASMLAEGCTIVQIAFFIFLTIWSVIFGFIALARKRRTGDKLPV
jgi:hypothetical protein